MISGGRGVLLSNTVGLFLLGVMTGWVVDVNFISAQSFLLSELEPSQGLVAIIGANLAFSFFLGLIHRHRFKVKFSVFGACCAAFFLVLLFGLQLPFLGSETRGILWLGVSIFGSGLFRWINDDLAIKHLNPGQAEASFFYLASAREIGTILSFLTLRFWTEGFAPGQMIQVVSVLIVGWLALVLAQFAPRANLEIQYGSREGAKPPALDGKDARLFIVFFLLMMFFLGLSHVGQEYLLLLALKQNVSSFEALKDIQAEYYLVASLLVVALGPLAARWIQSRRSSPLRLLSLYAGVMLLFLGLCWVHPVFFSFIALEVGQVVAKSVVGEPGCQMIYAAFKDGVRNRLRSWGVFFFDSLAGLPFLVLLPFLASIGAAEQVRILLPMAAACVIAGAFLAWRARLRLVPTLYGLFGAADKESSILAAQALSYLRPKDFTSRMDEMLKSDPKNLLRKTIILGLAYSKEAKALDAVVREFQSDKEEIQLAVLDAMRVFRNYRALQFAVDVMSGRVVSKSLQVRVNASRLIGAIYGRRAIPFLLRGLEDSDPRIVANTLETLGEFQDRKLIGFFEVLLAHSVPRVRLNALMAVSPFRETRRLYREGVASALRTRDPAWIASSLYVVGRLRDSFFLPLVERLLDTPLAENPRIRGGLAWALTRLGDARGFERFATLVADAQGGEESATLMHFFGQLPPETRFEAIERLVRRGGDASSVKSFARTLRESSLDFHRELEYLDLLWRSGHGGEQLVDCAV